ncbi:hypothetical protein EDB86DRAFT_3005323 [Lactarius hatsudake]|nr:hypothetical protein EDB86DRAFT_3005323 [Lactarius hatsudake]
MRCEHRLITRSLVVMIRTITGLYLAELLFMFVSKGLRASAYYLMLCTVLVMYISRPMCTWLPSHF